MQSHSPTPFPPSHFSFLLLLFSFPFFFLSPYTYDE
jgi:hypothetical protein